MNRRLVIALLLCVISSSLYASNDWKDFEANDIYPRYDTANCVFPFVYNKKTYTNCTTDGENSNRPWCALTSEYVGLFTYCYDFWQSSLQCVFPFTVNGKKFDKCHFLSKTSKYKQCRSNNAAYPFRFCIEEHVSKSGRPLLNPSGCNTSYLALSNVHSKCAGPSDFAIPIPISDSDKQSILDTHNGYRAMVGAKSMFKLYWDDELADMAQTHSSMCAPDHDLSMNRFTLSYPWKNGQNMGMSTEVRISLSKLLTMMIENEKPQFFYGVGCKPAGSCTSYTQLMLSNITRVGCGVSHCLFPDRIERYLTCNYIHSQYTDNYMIPYVPGDIPGSDCPATKDSNNLCDCGGKICNFAKGESLEPNTCKCVDGVGKREAEVSVDELENKDDAFVALPGAKNLEAEAADRREMRKMLMPNTPAKREFRKLPSPMENNNEKQLVMSLP